MQRLTKRIEALEAALLDHSPRLIHQHPGQTAEDALSIHEAIYGPIPVGRSKIVIEHTFTSSI